MANDLPAHPQDPRWLPSRRTIVLIAAGLQLFAIVVAWAIIAATPAHTGPLVREVLVPEDVVYRDTEAAPEVGKQLPGVEVRALAAGTDSQREEGRTLFAEHCSSCHGSSGRGDGPAGTVLRPPPRDLTSLDGWKGGTRLSDIFRTLTLGLEGTQMPAFDYLPVEARFALAHHVAGQARDRPADTASSLDSLDAEFSLSAGVKEPNVVPLSTAMERLSAEAAPAPAAATPDRQAELAALEPRGASLFAQVVPPDRAERVGLLLRDDSSWRGDVERLRVLATGGMPANGFSARAAMLPADAWASLHRYLSLRFEAER